MEDRLALSALDWWEEAGVDGFVDELPRNWLATMTPASVASPAPDGAGDPPAASLTTQVATPRFPGDLAAFRAFLLTDASLPGRAAARVDAVGDPASGTMIVLDMPEAEDRAARSLLSNEAGALFDRMLAAMGLSRDTAYLAPFSPARPPSGRLDAAAIAALLPALRHHLALVRPRRLLLMGEAPVQALLGLAPTQARGRDHAVEVAGSAVPAVASFTPRFILQASAPEDRKARRAQVWADLQRFMAL